LAGPVYGFGEIGVSPKYYLHGPSGYQVYGMLYQRLNRNLFFSPYVSYEEIANEISGVYMKSDLNLHLRKNTFILGAGVGHGAHTGNNWRTDRTDVHLNFIFKFGN
jgi:hypothetical protein